ncbi:MAG TPA: c-type cytochrome [Vicinamibacterales bacterium]|nr:c-type cytochrome [Vicinamibacterales bacterium]
MPAIRLLTIVVACTLITACARPAAQSTPVERGKYLVTIGGCNDCHTTKKMGPNGPEPDTTKLLAGHPEDMKMPAPPSLPPNGPWAIVVAPTLTAWSGPWGTSFAANLTPDANTGLGNWTEDMFVKAMRTGKHMGVSRPILPPMPVQELKMMSDEDLKAVFAYLKSVPPVVNHVPDPVPPAAASGT